MFNFNFFKSTKQEEAQPTWNANTMTMEQPASPASPSQQKVVAEQPSSQEQMNMNLRGGGEGADICCGVCAGIACFECCECCC